MKENALAREELRSAADRHPFPLKTPKLPLLYDTKGEGHTMWEILLYLFAAIGIFATLAELFRLLGKRRLHFTCLLFGDAAKEAWENKRYDTIVLCRSELQEEELIRRFSENEKRKLYIKRW